MELQSFQINTFTDNLQDGNRVTVIPLRCWPADDVLRRVAGETLTYETVFVVQRFPVVEVRLFNNDTEEEAKGHILLAAAHALKTILHYQENRIVFQSPANKTIVAVDNKTYTLSVKAQRLTAAKLPPAIAASVSIQPIEIYKGEVYLLVYPSELILRNLTISNDALLLAAREHIPIIATSPGLEWDVVSRPLAAEINGNEVSSLTYHGALIPYWCWKTGKNEISSMYLGNRINRLYSILRGKWISMHGMAKTYSIGTIFTD